MGLTYPTWAGCWSNCLVAGCIGSGVALATSDSVGFNMILDKSIYHIKGYVGTVISRARVQFGVKETQSDDIRGELKANPRYLEMLLLVD